MGRAERGALVGVVAIGAVALAWWSLFAGGSSDRSEIGIDSAPAEAQEVAQSRDLVPGPAMDPSAAGEQEVLPRADAVRATAPPEQQVVEVPAFAPWESPEWIEVIPAEDAPPTFEVAGALLRESGPWTRDQVPGRDELVIELVSIEDPQRQHRARFIIEDEPDGTVRLGYAFTRVLEGEYELSIFSLGALRWSPSVVRVVPPAHGMDFLCHDLDEHLALRFQVFDAETGEELSEFNAAHLEQTVSAESGVFMHAGPIEAGAFPTTERFRWSLWADGYRPAFGDERAFQQVDGARVARVDLVPGWAARVVVLGRDPTMRPLMNAEVLVDGSLVGRTDEEGALVLEFDGVPESIDVRYRDWKLENDPFDARPGTSSELRGHVLPLIVLAPE